MKKRYKVALVGYEDDATSNPTKKRLRVPRQLTRSFHWYWTQSWHLRVAIFLVAISVILLIMRYFV